MSQHDADQRRCPSDARYHERDASADLVLRVDNVLYHTHRERLAAHSARVAQLDPAQAYWSVRLPPVPDLVGHNGRCFTSPVFRICLDLLYGPATLSEDGACARCVLRLLVLADFLAAEGLRARCEYVLGATFPLNDTNWRPLLRFCRLYRLSVRIPIVVYAFLYDRCAYNCRLRDLFVELDPDDFCGLLLLPTVDLSALERFRMLVQYGSGRVPDDDDRDDDDDEFVLRPELISPEKFCSMVTTIFATNGSKAELDAVRTLAGRVRFGLGHEALDRHWRDLLDKMLVSSAVRALIRNCCWTSLGPETR